MGKNCLKSLKVFIENKFKVNAKANNGKHFIWMAMRGFN